MESWNKIETHTPVVTLSLTKESRIYNGETFLISGAGKLDT